MAENNERSQDNTDEDEAVVPAAKEAPKVPNVYLSKPTVTDTIVSLPKKDIATRFKKLTATRIGKIGFIAACLLVIFIIILCIPTTRYGLSGLFVKKEVTVQIIDMTTGKPVTDAEVSISGTKKAVTDKEGTAHLKVVPVGQGDITVTKKYYKSAAGRYDVPLFSSAKDVLIQLKADGRPVSFTVTDMISGAALADAVLKVSGTSATTDKTGAATIVVPDKGDMKATLSANGYNGKDVTLAIDTGSKNGFTLTRSGQVVFLNNANGTIDVKRTNIDGSDGQVIVAGTGKENKYTTALLSAQDWRYSVLKASRDSEKEKLYLVTTKDGTLDDVDEGDVDFTLIGWLGHTFYYTVDRNGPSWNDHDYALKSYNADTRKLATLDETSGSGSDYYSGVYQTFSSVYLLNNEVVYAKYWNAAYSYNLDGKNATLYSISSDTGKKASVKDYPQQNAYVSLSLYEPQGVYIRYTAGSDQPQYFEYEDHAVKTVDAPQGDFYDYPTYLASPSNKKTFWYELRNGKNTLFIGDDEGKNPKQVATLSEYVPYGWYGDNDEYVLFTKKGSELYIAPAGSQITDNALKITDYYKVQTYNGYGKGYGGQ